ncbi:hypothetical protein H1Q63_11680 [Desmonostoc muscorum CCALA 125]|uniref:Uncharacterized protein n=1 Tax=Desmonostoc muscorum LEGE 12446 TaxID=1828758 RepID=A0A8J7AD26_DESMC|nr:hypothetical protein [Desmonostoc muscorum]MBX9254598.1 hypothetical protein [Desmonostoc muscorum CCALA 125]MCF2149422.1 hypothetical protein [Desmonostoc muscorum LEGE 12446]
MTDYYQIERCWEIVESAFLMVSLQFCGLNQSKNIEDDSPDKDLLFKLCQHPW